jgi:hypothetical protein
MSTDTIAPADASAQVIRSVGLHGLKCVKPRRCRATAEKEMAPNSSLVPANPFLPISGANAPATAGGSRRTEASNM